MPLNWGLYLLIFLAKIIENSLATLRLILVANGKKVLGAVLNFVITVIWAVSTGAAVTKILEDPLKLLFLALGALVGSYVGSFIEQKLALGNSMVLAIVDPDDGEEIIEDLYSKDLAVTTIEGKGKDHQKNILMILIRRKRRHEVTDIITNIDKRAMVVSENAIPISGGYKNNLK